jgi:uncharacterized OsmC-like protein
MDANDLKTVQDSLRQRYAHDPDQAQVTMVAHGRTSHGLECDVETVKGIVEAGPHPGMGGDGTSTCPGDMLLEALVGCAGVTLRAVAAAMEITLRDAVITAEGDLDLRGALGIDDAVPVGFCNLRLRFDLDTDATDEQREMLMRLTERYCVVLQTLRPEITARQGAVG